MNNIVEQIDAEIARLQHAREALIAISGPTVVKRPVGRPKNVTKAAEPVARTSRVMSPEGKARIAAAQKKRWAKTKRLAKKAALAT